MELSVINGYAGSTYKQTDGKTLGKDDFLDLFIVQLQHQDPLNPMDSASLTAQLAQFSSLEQLSNISSQLNDMLLYQNSLQNTLTTTLIGKTVKFEGDDVYNKDGATIAYNLSADASKVVINIYDSSGKLVRTDELGSRQLGENTYKWDGKDSSGIALPEGQYKFSIEAFDSSGNSVNALTMGYGTVTGVTFDNNITYLVVDGYTKIQLSEIKEISSGGA